MQDLVMQDLVTQDLVRVISDVAATITSRSNVYAYRPGCMLDLQPYLGASDERFNDVQVAMGCKQ